MQECDNPMSCGALTMENRNPYMQRTSHGNPVYRGTSRAQRTPKQKPFSLFPNPVEPRRITPFQFPADEIGIRDL
jgi:hypothetical protein